MPKKYKLKQTLLMPGMMPIILPVGYEVELKGDRYLGEGGWIFHPHGVEDNKYHWEEIKEKERIEVTVYNNAIADEKTMLVKFSKPVTNQYNQPIAKAIESILNNEPIEEQKTKGEVEVEKTLNEWQNGIFRAQLSNNQPLTGELITLEECERRIKSKVESERKKAWSAARLVNHVLDNHISFYYKNVHEYIDKQSTK